MAVSSLGIGRAYASSSGPVLSLRALICAADQGRGLTSPLGLASAAGICAFKYFGLSMARWAGARLAHRHRACIGSRFV